eukprot:2156326-Pyramimonas_sp.AAC.1
MLRAHIVHAARARAKLKSSRPGSKGWWNLSRDLLHEVTTSSSLALRSSGAWITDAREKANLFAA